MSIAFGDFIQTLSYQALSSDIVAIMKRSLLDTIGVGVVGSTTKMSASTRQRWTDVTLYLEDGREIQSEPNTPRGDPEDPLSDQEISAKFHLLANPVIGEKRAMAIEERVSQVDETGFDLEHLLDLVLAPTE